MTLTYATAGILVYTLNALAERDSARTTSDILSASESENGTLDFILRKGRELDVDVSLLEHWFAQDASAKAAVDDMYARWLNASETGSYLLSSDVNGWLWLSSISVDAFFIARDSEVPLQ